MRLWVVVGIPLLMIGVAIGLEAALAVSGKTGGELHIL